MTADFMSYTYWIFGTLVCKHVCAGSLEVSYLNDDHLFFLILSVPLPSVL